MKLPGLKLFDQIDAACIAWCDRLGSRTGPEVSLRMQDMGYGVTSIKPTTIILRGNDMDKEGVRDIKARQAREAKTLAELRERSRQSTEAEELRAAEAFDALQKIGARDRYGACLDCGSKARSHYYSCSVSKKARGEEVSTAGRIRASDRKVSVEDMAAPVPKDLLDDQARALAEDIDAAILKSYEEAKERWDLHDPREEGKKCKVRREANGACYICGTMDSVHYRLCGEAEYEPDTGIHASESEKALECGHSAGCLVYPDLSADPLAEEYCGRCREVSDEGERAYAEGVADCLKEKEGAAGQPMKATEVSTETICGEHTPLGIVVPQRLFHEVLTFVRTADSLLDDWDVGDMINRMQELWDGNQ